MSINRCTLPWAAALAAVVALASIPAALAQSQAPISLEPSADRATPPHLGGALLARDYRGFGQARVGQSSNRQAFTFAFHQSTRVTGFSSTGDFRVAGGTCIEGHTYTAGDVCSVDVVFSPQGPGHRMGKLVVTHSASAQPMVVPMGGEALGPVVSFIPATMTTIAGTNPGGVGLLSSPQALTMDGGDNLFIADSGNNLIRYREAGGALSVIAGGGSDSSVAYSGLATGVQLTNPYSVAVDDLGNFAVSDAGASVVRVSTFFGEMDTAIGGGTNTSLVCDFLTPCDSTQIPIHSPYGLAFDSSNNLFVNLRLGATSAYGAVLGEFISGEGFAYTDTGGGYLSSTVSYALAVDANDTVYYAVDTLAGVIPGIGSLCYLYAQNQSFNDGAPGARVWPFAGNKTCGFSGDGGLALGAEISTSVQGFAFDAAGDLYFTDTGNQRVRRIDAVTGIIRTVAGNGVSGYTGDAGPATSAELSGPTGIALDSQGQVYVTSLTGTGSHAVVREATATGRLVFSTQALSTHSGARTVLVSNTGNDTLNFTTARLTSGNTGDFAIDSNTTSCRFTAPLPPGHNCYVGVVFTPTATGARSAVLTLLDDTVTGSNNINLSGTGATPALAVLTPTTLAFTSQTQGTTSAAKNVTLQNTGGLPLSITGFTITGANATEFAQTHTCSTGLAAGSSCTIHVTFTPAATGSKAATLTVATTGGSPTAALGGTGATVIVIKPNPIGTPLGKLPGQ